MADVRKNQRDLSKAEWTRLIDAINATHGMGIPAPRYRDFVRVHVEAMNPMSAEGMSWGVHTMGPGMVGRNFLAWHRRFIRELELRLQVAKPGVTLPYWDWEADRKIPAPLTPARLLHNWGVTRHWDASLLPTPHDLAAVMAQTTFRPFQRRLENIHGYVHEAVGGTMGGASSPADPLFFLHHANIDRIWSQWERSHRRAVPPNGSETLKPKPILGVSVKSVLRIRDLGYSYA